MNEQMRAVLCALLLMVPSMASGQARVTGADLAGVVTDQSGGVLPGAMVTVTNVATNLTRSVVCDTDGRYIVPALAPGTYAIAVELSGFATNTRGGIVLALGQAVTIDFTLALSGTREEVTVTADAPLVQIGRTEVSTVVNQHFIDNLPIN